MKYKFSDAILEHNIVQDARVMIFVQNLRWIVYKRFIACAVQIVKNTYEYKCTELCTELMVDTMNMIHLICCTNSKNSS